MVFFRRGNYASHGFLFNKLSAQAFRRLNIYPGLAFLARRVNNLDFGSAKYIGVAFKIVQGIYAGLVNFIEYSKKFRAVFCIAL